MEKFLLELDEYEGNAHIVISSHASFGASSVSNNYDMYLFDYSVDEKDSISLYGIDNQMTQIRGINKVEEEEGTGFFKFYGIDGEFICGITIL